MKDEDSDLRWYRRVTDKDDDSEFGLDDMFYRFPEALDEAEAAGE